MNLNFKIAGQFCVLKTVHCCMYGINHRSLGEIGFLCFFFNNIMFADIFRNNIFDLYCISPLCDLFAVVKGQNLKVIETKNLFRLNLA